MAIVTTHSADGGLAVTSTNAGFRGWRVT